MTEAPIRFAGFRPAGFAFFSGLRDNNDPAWFKPRKAVYEAEVLEPFRALIIAVAAALHEAGLPLVGDARHGIFRIDRDVRFSSDKRLYKTHAGAVLTRSGRKRDPGLLYLHVAPAESMVAAVVDRIVDFAHTALPLLEWGWAAVDGEAPAAVHIRAPSRPLPKPDF